MQRVYLFLVMLVLSAPVAQAQQRAAVFVDPIDLAQLKAECLTNPNNYSYTDAASNRTLTLQQWFIAGDDTIVANILNQTRAAITIYRTDVGPDEVKEAIAVGQFISAASQNTYTSAWLNAFFSGASVRLVNKVGTDSRVLTNLLAALTNGSASEARVRALGSRTGSRAEQLWGCTVNIGTGCEYVTVDPLIHVVRARQLP